MPISRDAVIWGYRLFLGRDPESEQAINDHIHVDSLETLGAAMLLSREFRESGRYASALRPSIPKANANDDRPRLLILGNCQALRLAEIIRLICPAVSVDAIEWVRTAERPSLEDYLPDVVTAVQGAAHIYLQPYLAEILGSLNIAWPVQHRTIESITFAAYHPDITFADMADSGKPIFGPIGQYQSALALWSYREGLSVDETTTLFRADVYRALGYFDFWDASIKRLRILDATASTQLVAWAAGHRGAGTFMHSVNHPTQPFLTEYAAQLLEGDGYTVDRGAAKFGHDAFLDGPVWPVYPPLAQAFGFEGDYNFKMPQKLSGTQAPVKRLGLHEFVSESFALYRRLGGAIRCDRIEQPPFKTLREYLAGSAPTTVAKINSPSADTQRTPAFMDKGPRSPRPRTPYTDLADYHYWSRSVARVAPPDVDLMVESPRLITPFTRVASAGSCFAQHIARALREAGQHYFVTETGADLDDSEARRRQYGAFSARYGNLYTPRQLVQLFDRAYGQFEPEEPWWTLDNGRVVDPFRPTVEPDGFENGEAAARDRQAHYAAVRVLFEQLDVFIFTLGLTEAWCSSIDGAVFPVVPGAHGGEFDTSRYAFTNFSHDDIRNDLEVFQARLQSVNPTASVIYTVSPVPLVATYEAEHVAVASSASKSILRAAAREVVAAGPRRYYFPSYELITGPWTRGAYFAEDARTVTDDGVANVMRCFRQHFLSVSEHPHEALLHSMSQVLCDEELLDPKPVTAIPVSTESPVVHLHVQKSGGSSLNEMLVRAYTPTRSRTGDETELLRLAKVDPSTPALYFGHLNADVLERLPSGARGVVMLRDPVARLRSAYQYYCALDPNGPEGHRLVKKAHACADLHEFLQDPFVRASLETWNHQTWVVAGARRWQRWLRALQAQSGNDRVVYLETEVLPELRQSLQGLHFVGFFEQFDADAGALLRQLGHSHEGPVPRLNTLNDARDRNSRAADQRTDLARGSLESALIEEYTMIDAVLYREAISQRHTRHAGSLGR